MPKNKRSFFDRLTGSVSMDDYDTGFEEENAHDLPIEHEGGRVPGEEQEQREEETEGQLTVDVFQTNDEIIIKAIVAGVKPDDLDVSITRDMITIRGKREEHKEVTEDNYFYKELYWGGFSRTILLPQEIEVEEATAVEKHGLLTLRLPKIDKEKQTKLKVKAN